MIENGLVDFDEKTGGQPIAFGLGKATQGMDIVAFGLIGASSESSARLMPPRSMVAHAEIPQEVIALNIA